MSDHGPTVFRNADPDATWAYTPQADVTNLELAWLMVWMRRGGSFEWLKEKCGDQVMRHFTRRK